VEDKGCAAEGPFDIVKAKALIALDPKRIKGVKGSLSDAVFELEVRLRVSVRRHTRRRLPPAHFCGGSGRSGRSGVLCFETARELICLMSQLDECFAEEQVAETVGDTYSSSTTREAVAPLAEQWCLKHRLANKKVFARAISHSR
jgi:hypothetical protein